MRYRFQITAQAMADSDEAYAWLAERSPEAAERWYQSLFKQIETLTRQPKRCPLAAENAKFPAEIRELLDGRRNNKYRIIFTIRENTVVVLSIHHGARKELEP